MIDSATTANAYFNFLKKVPEFKNDEIQVTSRYVALITYKNKIVANAQYSNTLQSGFRSIGLNPTINPGTSKIADLEQIQKVISDYYDRYKLAPEIIFEK